MRRLLFPLFALLLLAAAACTQAKPAVPTPTLVPLNQTPLLPLSITDTPAPGGTPQAVAPGGGTPGPVATAETVGPTFLPTPTSGFATAIPVAPATLVPGSGTTEAGGTTAGGCPNPYIVQRGEWFYSIARKCGVSARALIAANPTTNPNYVYPGQVLRIPTDGGAPPPGGGVPSGGVPSGRTYVVRPGDTLFSIAIRFGVSYYALAAANGLANPNFIYVGQVLRIP